MESLKPSKNTIQKKIVKNNQKNACTVCDQCRRYTYFFVKIEQKFINVEKTIEKNKIKVYNKRADKKLPFITLGYWLKNQLDCGELPFLKTPFNYTKCKFCIIGGSENGLFYRVLGLFGVILSGLCIK